MKFCLTCGKEIPWYLRSCSSHKNKVYSILTPAASQYQEKTKKFRQKTAFMMAATLIAGLVFLVSETSLNYVCAQTVAEAKPRSTAYKELQEILFSEEKILYQSCQPIAEKPLVFKMEYCSDELDPAISSGGTQPARNEWTTTTITSLIRETSSYSWAWSPREQGCQILGDPKALATTLEVLVGPIKETTYVLGQEDSQQNLITKITLMHSGLPKVSSRIHDKITTVSVSDEGTKGEGNAWASVESSESMVKFHSQYCDYSGQASIRKGMKNNGITLQRYRGGHWEKAPYRFERTRISDCDGKVGYVYELFFDYSSVLALEGNSCHKFRIYMSPVVEGSWTWTSSKSKVFCVRSHEKTV